MLALPPMDSTSLLLGGVCVLCVLWWLSTRRPPGLPPGPGPALPLLGHLHLLAKDPRAQFWTWRRQYGDVFSLYMGGRLVVVLASYSAIREALVTFADVFSDRPHSFAVDYILKKKGISGSSGSTWKEQRKTSLGILRQMGMGKNVLAEKIQEEITHYIRAIRDNQGAPVDIARMTQVTISNNICSIVFGKRFHYQDSEFIGYLRQCDEVINLITGSGILNFLPILGYLPGDPFKMKRILANMQSVFGFINQQMAHHQEIFNQDRQKTAAQSADFVYSYLHQIQESRILGPTNSTLDEDNLRMCIADLFMAGTETTSTAILWALLFFLHHPHVQDKCFQEISDVIGPHRPPSMSDRPKMMYLEATICEVLRRADIVPLSLPHSSARDTIYRGYVIPKDTIIIPDISCVLQDPEIWEDPEDFRPERFIGPDGKLTRPDEFIPFSAGRRMCLGESLARMELFLYLATIIQHFRFLPPEEGQLPSLEGVMGMTHTPLPYKIRAVSRM
ncbi:hypothetical protein ACOMHN_009169 [Nucella lapillus]